MTASLCSFFFVFFFAPRKTFLISWPGTRREKSPSTLQEQRIFVPQQRLQSHAVLCLVAVSSARFLDGKTRDTCVRTKSVRFQSLRKAHRICYGCYSASRRYELCAVCYRRWRKIHCFHLIRVWMMRLSGSSMSPSTRGLYRPVRSASLLLLIQISKRIFGIADDPRCVYGIISRYLRFWINAVRGFVLVITHLRIIISISR